MNTPDHSDAAIAALAEFGVRAIFAHGWPLIDPLLDLDGEQRA